MRRPFMFAVVAALAAGCHPKASARLEADPAPAASSAPSPFMAQASWTARTISGCDVRFADAPERVATDLVWRACSGSSLPAKACRELGLVGATTGVVRPYAVGAHTASGTMLFVRVNGLPPGTERYVLGPPDGPPRVVMTARCASPAAPGAMSVGADGAALELEDAADTTFLAGPFAAGPAWQAPAARYGVAEFGEVILDMPFAVAGRSIRAVDARMRVFRSAPGTGAFTSWPASFGSTLEHAAARGDTTLFVTASIPEVIAAQIGSAPPAVWYKPPPGGGVSAPALDGATAYFLVGAGRDRNNAYASLDVFAAAIPTSAPVAGASVRRVGSTWSGGLRWMDAPVAGAGHVAWRVWIAPGQAAVDVLDVASSRRVRFVPGPTRRVGRLLYVDDAELGVDVVDATDPSMTAAQWTWRVRLDALPAAP